MGKIYTMIVMVSLLAGFSAHAEIEGSGEPLSFKAWRDQQQVDSQNQLARINNRIVLLKAGMVKPEEILNEFNRLSEEDRDSQNLTARAKKLSSSDVLSRLEREQARAQKSIEFAKDLGIEEYFLGYLNQFQDNQTALAQVASRLSKEEVAELLKVMLKANSQSVNAGKSGRVKSALQNRSASF